MKIGGKIWSNQVDYGKEIEKFVDFIEVMALDIKDIPKLKKLKVPITIHNMHHQWGIDFSDRDNHHLNYSSILTSLKFAEDLGSDFVVIHGGGLKDKGCKVDNLISFFNKLGDKRVILENSPKLLQSGKAGDISSSFEVLKKWKEFTKRDICLDFSHAMITGKILGCDYYEYAKKFFDLNPKYFHVGGLRLDGRDRQDIKEHLSFKEGNIDLMPLLRLIPKDARIVVETEHDVEKEKEDFKWLRSALS